VKYRAEIDGLRALAVLPVILFHAGFEWFSGGFVGVDVFFVISGYLITTIIINDMAEGQFSIINFYERRARRILPALFFVMLACIPFAWLWLTPSDLKDFGQSLVAVSTFSSNILFWSESGYFDTAAEIKPLLHTWSLAVEEQYYILFPIFLMLTWRLGLKRILSLLTVAFVISLGVAHWGAFAMPKATFYLLPTRGWELLIGVFAAFYLKHNDYLKSDRLNQVLSLLGFGLVVGAIIAFDHSTPFPSLYALIPTVGTVLLILTAVPKTWIYKLLSYSPIVGIGLISYSAYLWHQPILAFARQRLLGEISDVLLLLFCLSSLVIGYVSWMYVEKPFRNKKKITRRSIFFFSLAGMTLFSLSGLITHNNNGFIDRYPSFLVDIMEVTKSHIDERDDRKCFRVDKQSSVPNCIKGSATGVPNFAVIGDSHASTLVSELNKIFVNNNSSFVQYTKSACPPIFEFIDRAGDKCDVFIDNVVSDLASRNIETVILLARWSYYIHDDDYSNANGGVEFRGRREAYSAGDIPLTSNFSSRRSAILEGYEEFVHSLIRNGIRVIVLGPVPAHAWDVPSTIIKFSQYSDHIVSLPPLSYAVYEERNKEVLDMFNLLSKKGVIAFVDSGSIFCNGNSNSFGDKVCHSIENGEVLYYDDDHLSNSGASILLNGIEDLLFK